MKIFFRLLINTYKSTISFRFNYIVGFIFSLSYIVLQIYIWKALYSNCNSYANYTMNLSEMITYYIFASIIQQLTNCNIMYSINNMILNGSISLQLLMPTSFIYRQFLESASKNIISTMYNAIPPAIIAFFLFRTNVIFTASSFFLFILSTILAAIIGYYIGFIMGLTAIWLRNAFFLRNCSSVMFGLFSGFVLPMWIFPKWLNYISCILPFRYIIYEPLTILLGKNSHVGHVILSQIFWIIILSFISSVLWKTGKQKLYLQGG